MPGKYESLCSKAEKTKEAGIKISCSLSKRATQQPRNSLLGIMQWLNEKKKPKSKSFVIIMVVAE